MNPEILEGLKNAISHGSSLDDAVRSFIGAGYSPIEVKEAAQSLTSGTLALMAAPPEAQSLPSSPIPQQELSSAPAAEIRQIPSQLQSLPSSEQPKPEKKGVPKWMKIAIVALLLLIILFGLYMLIFPSNQAV